MSALVNRLAFWVKTDCNCGNRRTEDRMDGMGRMRKILLSAPDSLPKRPNELRGTAFWDGGIPGGRSLSSLGVWCTEPSAEAIIFLILSILSILPILSKQFSQFPQFPVNPELNR
jgi:hypothetical protein